MPEIVSTEQNNLRIVFKEAVALHCKVSASLLLVNAKDIGN